MISELVYTTISKGLAFYDQPGTDNDQLIITLAVLAVAALFIFIIKYNILKDEVIIANS